MQLDFWLAYLQAVLAWLDFWLAYLQAVLAWLWEWYKNTNLW